MRPIIALCLWITLAGCASGAGFSELVRFKNSNGEVISLNRDVAIIREQTYYGRDCSSESMYCVDYAGFFSIIAPKKCMDIDRSPWRVGRLLASVLGLDYHTSTTMYGVSRGEMVAYTYAWDGAGIVGLVFDSAHKVANDNALDAMGYRDPSIFYEKASKANFFSCENKKPKTKIGQIQKTEKTKTRTP